MIIEILSVVAPVFFMTALGYGWSRAGLPFDNPTVSSLVMYLGTPGLVFYSLTSLRPALIELQWIALAAVAAIFVCVLLGYPLLRLMGWSQPTFLPSLAQPNTGNMGLPLVMLTFGEAGLATGTVIFFVHALSQNSLGIAISSGNFNPFTLLRQPILWAVLASCLVIGFDVPVPRWLQNTSQLLGGLLIPGMLIMLGNSLARLTVTDLPKAAAIACFRLCFGVVAAGAVIFAFGLKGVDAGVLFLQVTMPVAVFNFVFADRFGRNPEQVAAVVLISTTLMMVLLPVVVAISLWLAGMDVPQPVAL